MKGVGGGGELVECLLPAGSLASTDFHRADQKPATCIPLALLMAGGPAVFLPLVQFHLLY